MKRNYKHINEFNVSAPSQKIGRYFNSMGFGKRDPIIELTPEPISDSTSEEEKSETEEEEEEPILGKTLPTNDPTYGAITSLDKDMSSNDMQLKKNLIILAKAHDAILNLYNNSLYEESWDDTTIYKFDKLLKIYNDAFAYVKLHITDIPWNYAKNKNKFFQIYNDIIKKDNYTFNRVKARHENYKRYRTNRKSIISQIAKIVGCKGIDGKDLTEVLNYLNDKCAKVPLYDNHIKGDVTIYKKPVLAYWIKTHIKEVMDELKYYIGASSNYDQSDIYEAFRVYVKAREMAFKIFNMITSNSKYNGWEKWNKAFLPYCNADMNDVQLRKLYNAADAENSFEEVDDYQQDIDDKTWNRMGLYESWWDEGLDWYKQRQKDRYSKDKIKGINMIAKNANACKVATDGKYVYSNVDFYPGDIIEICPTKPINKSSLYSQDMRDVVFEVVPNQEWVIPFGYCQYYDVISANQDANCDFLWDPINKVIVITAINKIPKYNKLILKTIK